MINKNDIRERKWIEITPDTLPDQNSWIEIKDKDEIQIVYVSYQFEFVPHLDSDFAYQGATHWRKV